MEERVISMIADLLDRPPGTISRNMTLAEIGGDSLHAIELVMEFEQEFDVDIPDSITEQWMTIGNAIDYLNGLSLELSPVNWKEQGF